MRFALIGSDADALAVARYVAGDPAHRLSCYWGADPTDFAPDATRLAHWAERRSPWESVLADDRVDALIVAGGDESDAFEDRLRKLVQQGMPMIVAHPVSPSMLFCFELDMIREETGCPMLPYTPARWHPVTNVLARMVAEPERSPLGTVQQIVFERRMRSRSETDVYLQFARDADLLRALCGDLARLMAMAADGSLASAAAMGVQLSSPEGVLVRWTAEAADGDPGATMVVHGAEGKATVEMGEDEAAWQVDWHGADVSDPAAAEGSYSAPAEAVRRFERLLKGETVAPTWLDAARALETASAIGRSLDRGRAVELHQDDFTEEGTFKGTMAWVGCLLLMGSLGLFLAAVVAASLDLPFTGYAPYAMAIVLALVMVVFLLLQLLGLVFPTAKR